MTRAAVIAAIVWLELLRRKDIYVLLILLGALLAGLVSLNVFGLGGATAYVKDIGLLLAWLFGWILAVSATARELPQEETRGTIFSLLAKPLRRAELLAGKWLGCWSIVAAAALAFYAIVAAVALAKGAGFDAVALAQGFVLHLCALGVICALALCCSTRLNADAAAALTYVVSAACLLLAPRLPHLAAYASGFRFTALLALYHALPHFDLFDMRRRLVHDLGPLPWPVFGAVAAYGIVLTALFLLLAWTAYRRKRFSRGALGA